MNAKDVIDETKVVIMATTEALLALAQEVKRQDMKLPGDVSLKIIASLDKSEAALQRLIAWEDSNESSV